MATPVHRNYAFYKSPDTYIDINTIKYINKTSTINEKTVDNNRLLEIYLTTKPHTIVRRHIAQMVGLSFILPLPIKLVIISQDLTKCYYKS